MYFVFNGIIVILFIVHQKANSKSGLLFLIHYKSISYAAKKKQTCNLYEWHRQWTLTSRFRIEFDVYCVRFTIIFNRNGWNDFFYINDLWSNLYIFLVARVIFTQGLGWKNSFN